MCRWSISAVRVRRDNPEQPFCFQEWNEGFKRDKKPESTPTFFS
jgi:hypothetical protein